MDTEISRTPPPELRMIRGERCDGIASVTVAGDIDMTTGDDFRRTVIGVLQEPDTKALVLDIAGVTFIDSNGVAVLVRAHREAEGRGASFVVVNAADATRSLLEMLGVYEMLTADRGAR